MERLARLGALALVIGATLAGASALAQEDIVTQRRNVMRAKFAEFRAVRDTLRNNAALTEVPARATRMAEVGDRLPGLVPEGSGVGETRALPAIWQNMDQFRQRSANFRAAARELAQVASGGDRAATQAAFDRMAATCDACHNTFRRPR